jgi:hypothetical protein
LQDLYWHNQNLKNVVLEKPGKWTTNMFRLAFGDISEIPDCYDWLQDTLIGSIYHTNIPTFEADPYQNYTKVLGANFLLGGIRLRQIRMRLAPCVGPPGMNVTECIPKYDDDLTDDVPFGPINEADGMGVFRWVDLSEPVSGLYSSLFSATYTKDGYRPLSASGACVRAEASVLASVCVDAGVNARANIVGVRLLIGMWKLCRQIETRRQSACNTCGTTIGLTKGRGWCSSIYLCTIQTVGS